MKTYVFFTWCLFMVLVLSFKAFTWDKELNGKPHIKFGETIVKTGKIFERPMDSVTYNKRRWFTYSPLIHKKPKKWGTYLR